MKKSMISLAVLAICAYAGAALAHGSDSSLTPSVGVQSSVSVSGYAGTGGGISLNHASNTVSAGVGGTNVGAAGALGPVRAGSVDISGTAATSSQSTAGNLSLGNASGSAAAAGVGQASIVGSGSFHTTANGPQGTVSGNVEAVTGTSVAAGTNQFGTVGGAAGGAFTASANATQFQLGPFNTANAGTAANVVVGTTPTVQYTVGGASVQIQNEAAGNAAGTAKVGTVASSTSN